MASLLAKMSSSFINTRRKLLKNRNWTFPVVRYFTRKLELVSDILWFIAAYIKRGRLQHTLLVVVFPHNNIHVKILSRLISQKNFFEKNQKNKTKLIYIYIYIFKMSTSSETCWSHFYNSIHLIIITTIYVGMEL